MEWIVMDIEGTTTSIDFVHKVLFPYSQKQLSTFLAEHGEEGDVQLCLRRIWTEDLKEPADKPLRLEAIEALLRQWIAEDRKHPLLKELQGKIWREGYLKRAYFSHFYPEVPRCLESWKKSGIRLAVYSSGSVEAQRLLFAHSEWGDLSPLISVHFDTAIGPKREVGSYQNLLRQLQSDPKKVLFLSDITQELDAAEGAGLRTCQLVRQGTEAGPKHVVAKDFDEVSTIFGLK